MLLVLFLFWQIRQNWDAKYWASFLLNDLFSFNKLHLSPPVHGSDTFPPMLVESIYTLCFKRWNHDCFKPHFGCHEITKDSIPLMLLVTLVSSLKVGTAIWVLNWFHLTSQLGDNGSTITGPFTSWSQHAFENRWPLLGAHWNNLEQQASLSPPLHCPQDTPLVSGPRAGDKVIFAILENKLGIYKRKRKHTKCISFFQNTCFQFYDLAEPESIFKGDRGWVNL